MNQELSKLLEKQNLSVAQAKGLVSFLTDEKTDPLLIAAILTALRMKGETVDEITGFIKGMQEKMISVSGGENAIDIVGTGGDGKHTFNISTAASFVVAGAGVKVAKHGNRAASSLCGSADVLEALGVNIMLDNKKAAKILQKVGIVFLFAPLLHPAMKTVIPVRKALKIKTIFNYLGPFLNPAKVKRQLLGVADVETARKMVTVAQKLQYKNLLIVTSEDGLDEISLFAKTHAFEITGKRVRKLIIDPKSFGFKKAILKDIVGADVKTNANMIRAVLEGEKGATRDIVLLNSAYALLVAGKVKSVEEGIQKATESIDSGNALQILEKLRKETNE